MKAMFQKETARQPSVRGVRNAPGLATRGRDSASALQGPSISSKIKVSLYSLGSGKLERLLQEKT